MTLVLGLLPGQNAFIYELAFPTGTCRRSLASHVRTAGYRASVPGLAMALWHYDVTAARLYICLTLIVNGRLNSWTDAYRHVYSGLDPRSSPEPPRRAT